MANILQVTTPPVNTDNRNILDSQEARQQAENQKIHNPVDPSRVVRADGREDGKAGDATGEKAYSVIDYESNYGAFVQKLKEGGQLARLLERLLFTDMSEIRLGGDEQVGELVARFLTAVRMNSPEELLNFLKSQEGLQARFSGPFFDNLRYALLNSSSDNLRDAIMSFLKVYNDYTSGSHLLQQMRTLTDDIGHLLLRQYQAEFQGLVDSMNWDAANGDTLHNAQVLNSRLIPFLSAYVSNSHDFGAVRDAVMLLIFHTVRYENGEESRLWQMFERMTDGKEFEMLYKGNAEEGLKSALGALAGQRGPGDFAATLSSLLLKGANGQAGLENIQNFYAMLNGMLLNESVYMPLLHILVPFQYQGKRVMSEIWADPDARRRREEEEGRKIKMYLKFDVQTLGKFELALALQNREVDLQLFVPPSLTSQAGDIQEHVAGIFKKNGMGIKYLMVRERLREGMLEEFFPEIREKERTINVRI